MRFDDTIAAISTPPGEGGVAMVRLSGRSAASIAERVFKFRKSRGLPFTPWRVYLGDFVDMSGTPIDECLCTFFRGPRSYTAEDVVEFSLHGGGFLAAKALDVLLNQGARLAEPGEFTRRAFVNGRIKLTEAEAVMDVIRASSDVALRQANEHLRGRLADFVTLQRESCLWLLALIEVSIDFPEDDIPSATKAQVADGLAQTFRELCSMADTVQAGRVTSEGLRVVLAGRPNAGKSSLLNALAGEDRAIVTDVAGTTRDTIEVRINLDGLLLTLWDTAGLREGSDLVEKLGVERAEKALEAADIVLVLIDGAGELHPDDRKLLKRTSAGNRIVLATKADLPRQVALAPFDALPVSVVNHEGLTELRIRLAREARRLAGPENALVITNMRHHQALLRSMAHLEAAQQSLAGGWELEIVAIDVRRAVDALGTITGDAIGEELADNIFGRFCIGK
ncbi:MAG TPA: tRNA uridine-5-carboxymethylaminomethyl(34) synthesis GTPase MnmE [Bacillota bacterium]|nr:tRNA uridine-5-carboxymethylaminomethyl(34) synthesis GTPase MnmE [Bacillota bacterium]